MASWPGSDTSVRERPVAVTLGGGGGVGGGGGTEKQGPSPRGVTCRTGNHSAVDDTVMGRHRGSGRWPRCGGPFVRKAHACQITVSCTRN